MGVPVTFTKHLAPSIFGFADGVVCAMGIICGMVITHQPPAAIWAAAFSAGLAEFAGMSAGQYQSAPEDGRTVAVVCGLSALLGAVMPAVPYLFTRGLVAVISAVCIAIVLCGAIARVQPKRTWKTYAISYGITACAVGLCLLGGLL
jgi:VIT1/CCC1 family predicted Fe2+/Mn2+ transporter